MSATVRAGYRQTEVGVIPEEWLFGELGELNPIVTSGSRGWAKYYSDLGAAFLRITNLSRESIYVDFTDLKLVRLPQNDTEGLRTQLQVGDLLISITADIGIIGYVDSKVPTPAYINQHIALLRFDKTKINTKFVSYFLASEKPQRGFRAGTDQGAKAGMNLSGVRKIRAILPPIPEQHAIATALSDVDALLAKLDALVSKKRDLKQATMQQLLTGKTRLPGFSEEWQHRKIGLQIDLLTGFPFPSIQYAKSGVRLLRGSNVKRGATDWHEDLVQFWPTITQDIKRYELEADDLVIAMDGSLVGRSYARLTSADLPAVLLQRVARIRSKAIDVGLLAQLVGSEQFVKYCDSVKTVTAIPHISAANILDFEVTLAPSIEEQTAIATILSDMDAELVALEARRDKTRALKQGMMQELLTGRIRLV